MLSMSAQNVRISSSTVPNSKMWSRICGRTGRPMGTIMPQASAGVSGRITGNEMVANLACERSETAVMQSEPDATQASIGRPSPVLSWAINRGRASQTDGTGSYWSRQPIEHASKWTVRGRRNKVIVCRPWTTRPISPWPESEDQRTATAPSELLHSKSGKCAQTKWTRPSGQNKESLLINLLFSLA